MSFSVSETTPAYEFVKTSNRRIISHRIFLTNFVFIFKLNQIMIC